MFGTRLVFGLLYHHLVNIIQHNIDNASRPTSRLKARDKRGEKILCDRMQNRSWCGPA
jgi:hypothetical protein